MNDQIPKTAHPSSFEPAVLLINVVLAFFGSIIGLQIITTLGVTPNTSIIGVLVAIIISRIPIASMLKFRDIHRQNLVQTAISTATFAAANSLMLPIAIPFVLGNIDLVYPMIIGAALGMCIDMMMMYWMFDTKAFPGDAAWPPGVAAAEAIKAGDAGGRRAWLLGYGIAGGVIGSVFKIPMSALGITMIANIWAMLMFAAGLLLRGYSKPLFGVDINSLYIPHGFMIGAGLAAGVQIILIFWKKKRSPSDAAAADGARVYTRSEAGVRKSLLAGFVLYLAAGAVLALLSGLYAQMPYGMLAIWVLYAAAACILAELIVGLSAMHSGWFPAFATALIFLVIGILIGFPPVALALLVGFIASGGPAFADGGFDFKSGWLLRGFGENPAYEIAGRRQQLAAAGVGLAVAFITVCLAHPLYFGRDLVPLVAKVFAAAINAGVDPAIIRSLALWAVPGAVLQAGGGAKRQMGVMMATGLLIFSPAAGFTVIAGLIIRLIILKWKGEEAMIPAVIIAAGCIAGDALFGFFHSLAQTMIKWR